MSETKKKKSTKSQLEIIDTLEDEEPVTVEEAEEVHRTALEKAREEELAALKALVEKLQKQLENTNPQIIQVVNDTEKITMRFQAEVSDDNVAVFGANGMYGQVTGKVGTVIVPKSEWSRFYDETNRRLIDRRWLIVLSGMSEEERKIYNCAYKEGEILDEKAFRGLLGMGRDLLAVFPKLCLEHQEMVGRRYIEAWKDGDPAVQDRTLIMALNEKSKEKYAEVGDVVGKRKGIFYPIIAGMNAKDLM